MLYQSCMFVTRLLHTGSTLDSKIVNIDHNIFFFLPTAPSVIIYDNACNLHQYILNREPVHFKSSWLLVDRFHWPNHTGDF